MYVKLYQEKDYKVFHSEAAIQVLRESASSRLRRYRCDLLNQLVQLGRGMEAIFYGRDSLTSK